MPSSTTAPDPAGEPAHTPSRSSGMQTALDVELARLEVTAVKADLVGAAVAALASALAYGAAGSAAAPVVAGCALAGALYFGVVLLLMRRGRFPRALRWGNPFLEISAPTIILTATALYASADAALTSSPAIVAYAIPVAVSVLRLRPLLSLFVGVVGGLQYLLMAHLVLLPNLSGGLMHSGAVRVPMVYANAAVILAAGVVAGLVTVALRNAVAAAHRETRSKDLFGKYRLGPVVAQGGMGVVLRATYCPEGGFQREVAIKRIHPHLARDEHFVAAFRDEAALCARLNHPNIVQVLDFGKVEDSYFFAMEFVDGLSLAQVMKRAMAGASPMPAPVAAYLVREICAGLHHAQEVACDPNGTPLKVIHRDLTPHNVLVSRTGQVKITDFGIAKALRSGDATHTQTVQGKLAYMAPEQARAQRLDARCDLFSVGIILWELLAGAYLFRRESDTATLLALLGEPIPPVDTARPGLALPGMETLVDRALQRDPGQRWQSAAQMVEELDALLAQHPAGAVDLATHLARLPPEPATTTPAPVVWPVKGGTTTDTPTAELRA